jgi:hypothetical protein
MITYSQIDVCANAMTQLPTVGNVAKRFVLLIHITCMRFCGYLPSQSLLQDLLIATDVIEHSPPALLPSSQADSQLSISSRPEPCYPHERPGQPRPCSAQPVMMVTEICDHSSQPFLMSDGNHDHNNAPLRGQLYQSRAILIILGFDAPKARWCLSDPDGTDGSTCPAPQISPIPYRYFLKTYASEKERRDGSCQRHSCKLPDHRLRSKVILRSS